MNRPAFIPDKAYNQLLANGHQTAGGDQIDPAPVVKLFTADAGATWLLNELDPDDDDIAFGLCDLGFGLPEMGSVRLSDLASVRGRLGLPIERDEHFCGDKPLSVYAAEARIEGRILT